MPPRRSSPRAAAPAASAPPIWNALLIAAAVSYGLGLLVMRGRLSWPPTQLLVGAYTLAGALALIGPVVLARRDPGEGGVGELVWLTGGLLIWANDLAAAVRGEWRDLAWATPLAYQPMGLTALAVMAAGWRCLGPGGRGWSWTNVLGWVLGGFWVGMAALSLLGLDRPVTGRLPSLW